MPDTESAVPPTKEKAVYSRPVFKQRLTVNSLEAQRVTARIFERVQRALLSLDVILRIIGKQEAIDPLAAWISEQMAALDRDFDQEAARLKALMDEHGIQAMPTYTHPAKYEIEISSPRAAQFAGLIRKLDKLMGQMDTLWLNSVLTSQQRLEANYQWQQQLFTLAGRIFSMEYRARKAVYAQDKTAETEEPATPETQDGSEVSEEEVQDANGADEPV
ncbi:conserved hypothetical protein [Candidatus Glomeribacter gigasporarum BEG34]|uniref:Plasmid-related protein n=1 Tax=Candidatus Glomeribacter gigasporarum BEG34 TaxID=1070319 RepID=G2JBB8_9BURK|nr:hypothetical protein [Candidatus Glomeribacter gigasporarum]CCD30072.1 conserved hypothetical protein [Candidatus Glomeribacter gigasporarum BEG34]